ncbi:MAG: UvrD-helicase domain-containing protein [Lachnospiraceae bacterium]|nr:UvrD-helicase domain-containing protein [Lachnospiraceae bacterium]
MDYKNELNPQQFEAVTHFKGPLLILAGAGSGKTRVITYRISYLINEYGVKPWEILALTFTNKAAGEMRDRVRLVVGDDANYALISTFHSSCVRFLRRYADRIGYERDFTIYDADDQKSLMKTIIKEMGLDSKKYKERSFLNEISAAKDRLISPSQFERDNLNDFSKKYVVKAYFEYEKRLKKANAFDFDDLIFKMVVLLKEHPEVLDELRNRYRYILVDEYQDTNYAQFELIRLLANTPSNEPDEYNLCVVGDDDQSIYGFRGALITNILDFEKHFPNTKVVKLEENYRSTANILDVANGVIKNNVMRKDKRLKTSDVAGDMIYYKKFNTDKEEALAVASAIKKAVLKNYADYNEFAILYRTNAQSRSFEEMLVASNIPYKIVGGINFYQRREIKDILAYLRIIENSRDEASLRRIINVPKRGIGNTSLTRLSDYALLHDVSLYEAIKNVDYVDGISRGKANIASFAALIEDFKNKATEENVSIRELIEYVLEETDYYEFLKNDDELRFDQRVENIEELLSKAFEYTNTEESPTLSGFLEEISLVADIDNVDDNDNVVLLMTLHSAKGLEFPYVFMPGMEDNLFPSYMSLNVFDPDEQITAIEEERRLCYVGITRAKKKLSLSSAISRFRNGELAYNKPSIFLSEIPRHLIKNTLGSLMPFDKEDEKTEPIGSTKKNNSYESSSNIASYTRPTANSFGRSVKPPVIVRKAKKSTSSGDSLQELLNMVTASDKSFRNANNTEEKQASDTNTSSKNEALTEFMIGQKANHPKFGEVLIVEVTPFAGDNILKLQLSDGSIKKVRSSFAKLTKL